MILADLTKWMDTIITQQGLTVRDEIKRIVLRDYYGDITEDTITAQITTYLLNTTVEIYGYNFLNLSYDNFSLNHQPLKARYLNFFYVNKDFILQIANGSKIVFDNIYKKPNDTGITKIDYTSSTRKTDTANVIEDISTTTIPNDYTSDINKNTYSQTITPKDRVFQLISQIFSPYKLKLMEDFEKHVSKLFLMNLDLLDDDSITFMKG